jgi:flagellar hook protein FlgE
MIRSLRTGVSGLLSNQVRMDVVGNNIANVNTLAYKRGRVAFNELLGQQLLGVGRMSGGAGVNPSYVGLGVSVGSIDQSWAQGALENTGRANDLALNGDGFFIAKGSRGNLLTRAGNFSFNRDGQFVTSTGLFVQGWGFDENDDIVTGVLKDVRVDPGMTTPARGTDIFTTGGNLSADAEIGEMKTISSVAYDESGKPYDVFIQFEKTEDLASGVGVSQWEAVVMDKDDVLIAGPHVLHFDPTGELCQADGTPLAADNQLLFNWDIDGDTGAEAFTVDFGGASRSGITSSSGSTTVSVTEQNGFQAGVVTGYSINKEGVLEFNFSNGQQRKLFQLAIGEVTNTNGLEQLGENFFAQTTASGELQVRQAGRESQSAVVSGALEMSNVDLATEFTDMIVAQRGFQASARVITTSDELLQEVVQLKR